jgi:predicted nucleic acid-binding protein
MIVLDTNVVSELMRPLPSAAVVRWISQHSADEIYSSTVVLAEVLYGIEILPAGKRRSDLLAGADKMFTVVLSGRILPFDEQSASVFAQIASTRRRKGRPVAELDAQIAAIASVHSASLATRNTGAFEGCGIRLFNPWVD